MLFVWPLSVRSPVTSYMLLPFATIDVDANVAVEPEAVLKKSAFCMCPSRPAESVFTLVRSMSAVIVAFSRFAGSVSSRSTDAVYVVNLPS